MEMNLSLEAQIEAMLSKFEPIKCIDGVHDTLTHLPAPSFFYEQLEREILISQRNSRPFQLIRLLLNPLTIAFTESDYEIALINFVKGINSVLRADDFFARLGKLEFYIIFHGSENDVSYLHSRISRIATDIIFYPLVASAQFKPYEGSLSILRRIDEKMLKPIDDCS